MASSLLPRSVKRYRAKNPYSFAFLFHCFDAIVGTIKIVSVLLLLAVCWKGYLWWIEAKSVNRIVEADLVKIVNTDPLDVVPAKSASTLPGIEQSVTPQNLPVVSGSLETETVLFDEAWLMSLSRDVFTVQLGTSPELDKLVAFGREVFADEQAHIFAFRVSSIGNPIYGLVFGEHADLQAAQEAVARFPAAYRQYDPWIRPVGQLQDQVQDTRNKLGW